jgi:lipoyl(octanoyl) transferase
MQPLTARLVPFRRRGGPENMAIDEHLLLRHGQSGGPVLRVYGWRPPAITLGRYQGTEYIDLDACGEDGVAVVRRITGGGAIFHDNEVTYSLVWPDAGMDMPGGIDRTFEMLNAFIMETYKSLGLRPVYAKDSDAKKYASGRAHFCFSGYENYDILIEGRKIGGNAQRRIRGSVLQHGSIPLGLDVARVQRYFRERIDAGHFTSLGAVCGREVPDEEVIVIMTAAFSRVMGVDLSEQDLDRGEDESVRILLRDRYSRDQWNYTAMTEARSE